jgi:hypothetical protein
LKALRKTTKILRQNNRGVPVEIRMSTSRLYTNPFDFSVGCAEGDKEEL